MPTDERQSSAPRFQAPPFGRALVVVNPVSGRGLGVKAARELVQGLEARGVEAQLFETKARGDAYRHLRSSGEPLDLVVAVGGDGTLREVFEGLVDPETPVGLLPFGTANVLAGELGLPRDIHHCLEILCAKRTTGIDVARVNGRLSFLCTGVGVDGEAVREVERVRRGPIRKSLYFRVMARILWRYRAPHLRVEIDGETLPDELGYVLVSNTASYGGVLHLDRAARIDDRLLEVYLFPRQSRLALISTFLRGVFGHLPAGRVRLRRASRIAVASAQDQAPVPYQVDGDLGGDLGRETPLEIDLAPHPYRLIVP